VATQRGDASWGDGAGNAIVMWFCTDCLSGNCLVCLDRGPQLDDGTVCECEHDDLEAAR
jgi:hypothetical protein